MTGNERIFPSRDARFSSPSLGIPQRIAASSSSSSAAADRRLSPRSLLANSLLPAQHHAHTSRAMDHGAAMLAPVPFTSGYNPLQGFQSFSVPYERARYEEEPVKQPASTHDSVSDDGESSADLHAATYSGDEGDDDAIKQEPGSASKKRRRERKERKPTHLVRREEKLTLEAEIAALQEQLESLKTQALVNKSLHVRHKTQAPVMNRILRETVQSRQLALADVQGMVSSYVVSARSPHKVWLSLWCISVTHSLAIMWLMQRKQHDISPINTLIRLGRDRTERHAQLVALKSKHLEAAKRFFEHRCRGLDLTKQYYEVERFETDRGDYCSIQFDVTQFYGPASVRAVFDAVLQHLYNVEISISEMLGTITIREDDDSGADGVQQYRLVSSNSHSPPIETNSIQFSHFQEASTATGGYESGFICGDFVDEDDLYPYRPSERLRKDVSAVIEVIRLPLPHRPGVSTGRKGEEFVVVTKRWSMVKLHHSELPMSRKLVQQTRDEMGRWADEVIRSMEHTLAR